MPWVYTLTLVGYRDAWEIKQDWEENIPGNANVIDEYGGVTVRSNGSCVIVSQRNSPEYEEMTDFEYVVSITEHKELPADPEPQELGLGIYCEFDGV